MLLLDGVSRDLDAARRQAVQGAIRQLAAQGSPVLLTTHDQQTVDALADRRVGMENGRITFDSLHRAPLTERTDMKLAQSLAIATSPTPRGVRSKDAGTPAAAMYDVLTVPR